MFKIAVKKLVANIQRNFRKTRVENCGFDRFWIALYNAYKFLRKVLQIDFILKLHKIKSFRKIQPQSEMYLNSFV